MTKIQVLDLFVCLVQQYMLANLMYKMGKTKYNYLVSMVFSMILMFGLYFVFNYLVNHHVLRLLVSLFSYPICGLAIYEGKISYRLFRILICYVIFVGLDILCSHFLLTWMPAQYRDNVFNAGMLISRNIYNMVFYSLLVVFELVRNWKEKNTRMKQLTASFVCLALAQIAIMYALVSSNFQGMADRLIATSIFYSGLIVLGYFITMEMFHQVVNQQRKKNELQHKLLERKYQYDYYLLARQQGEELRDLRHDMRNHLQMIQYLLHCGTAENRKRAENMLLEIENTLLQE